MKTLSRLACAFGLLGLGSAVHAEEFASKTGKFVKEGAYWVEYPPFDGVHHATFSELARTKKFVVLFDPTRDMILRFAFEGGMATWTDLNRDEWQGLTIVKYKP